jgi:hypothetical protein
VAEVCADESVRVGGPGAERRLISMHIASCGQSQGDLQATGQRDRMGRDAAAVTIEDRSRRARTRLASDPSLGRRIPMGVPTYRQERRIVSRTKARRIVTSSC